MATRKWLRASRDRVGPLARLARRRASGRAGRSVVLFGVVSVAVVVAAAAAVIVISPRRGPEVAYLEAVEAELDLLGEALAPRKILNQVHWGGGTPTYLSPVQCRQLFNAITSRFDLSPDAEVALEIDPCVTTIEHLATLRDLGFNRLSMGLQDL